MDTVRRRLGPRLRRTFDGDNAYSALMTMQKIEVAAMEAARRR